MNRLIRVVLLMVLLVGCSSPTGDVVIGSKSFTENELVAEIFALMIEEHTDLSVTRRYNIGVTSEVFTAYQSGEIDLYFEYSGTIVSVLADIDIVQPDEEDLYRLARDLAVEEFDSKFLRPVGLNNAFVMALRTDLANGLNVKTMSDLLAHDQDLVFGAAHSFYEGRIYDGYHAMIEMYGFNFEEISRIEANRLYEVVEQRGVDVVIGYATDSALIEYDMTVLEDDLDLFDYYHGGPLVSGELLEKHPEVEDVLNELYLKIDSDTIRQLNYEVDYNDRSVNDVAKEFLIELELID